MSFGAGSKLLSLIPSLTFSFNRKVVVAALSVDRIALHRSGLVCRLIGALRPWKARCEALCEELDHEKRL